MTARTRVLIGIIIVLLILTIGLTIALLMRKGQDEEGRSDMSTYSSQDSSAYISSNSSLSYSSPTNFDWSNGQCTGEPGRIELTHSPMEFNDFAFILPLGLMAGAHVTPVDHVYFSPADFNSPRDTYPVYAPADGYIVGVGIRRADIGAPEKTREEYRILMEHTCSMWSYFDLVTSLEDGIAQEVGDFPEGSFGHKNVRIPIKSGQLIGRIGGQTLDFGVYDGERVLDGFLTPELYLREPWKIHTMDPFDYFTPELKVVLLAKDVRQATPRGGKIDYDIEGKLVGNWFVKDTNGYQGNNPEAYWDTHLAVVYHYIDPEAIIISIGNFDGESKQLAVKGNSPNPATIGAESGIVKYDLVQYELIHADTGQPWDRMSYANDIKLKQSDFSIEGVVLFQVVDAHTLKMEVFPGKTSTQVNGFSGNEVIYER